MIDKHTSSSSSSHRLVSRPSLSLLLLFLEKMIGRKLFLRPRKADYYSLYFVAIVGLGSGYVIFAPPLQELQRQRQVLVNFPLPVLISGDPHFLLVGRKRKPSWEPKTHQNEKLNKVLFLSSPPSPSLPFSSRPGASWCWLHAA